MNDDAEVREGRTIMKPERLPGLDALRALAIVWVILFHAGTLSLGWPLGPVARFGWMGVDLFFVLSGFLIGAQWFEALPSRRAHFGAFYARRAYRIFPAYLVTLGLYAFMPATRERAQMQPLWQFFTFTENLLIDFSSSKTFSHVWSLCVEEHFYVVFPLLSLALFRGATLKRTVGFASLIILGGLAWRAHAWFDDVSLRGDDQAQYFYERIYYPTWTRLDGLVMGVLLAALKVFRPAWWKRLLERRALVLTLGVLLSGVAIWLFQEATTTGAVLFGYPILSLALTCFVAVGATPSMRAIPGTAFLAAISYSLYLTHKQALHLLQTWAGTTLCANDALAFGAYTLVVLAFGITLHFAVERPFLNLRARRSSSRATQAHLCERTSPGIAEEPARR